MIDQLWRGVAPPRAIASLQAYVSNLRRLLEPGRSQRAPGRILVSAPPGYAVRLPAQAVDAWQFERLLGQAQAAPAGDPATARQCLTAGLALWHGSAYAEFAAEEWAVAEAARLGELHLAAWELWAQVTLRAGTAAEVVPATQVMTRQNPLREEGWRLLGLALWGSGRQGDALAALRRARQVLGDELGIDPGPALVELEEAILQQRLEVLHGALGRAGAALPATGASAAAGPQAGAASGPGPDVPGQGTDAASGEVFLGRGDELTALRGAAGAARRAGSVVLVIGEAGIGKSSLLSRAREQLTADGWIVVAGSCPETDGVPPAWAWVQALRALAHRVPPADAAPALAPLLEDSEPPTPADAASGRFRLHRAVASWLRAAVAASPVAVFLDDLHNADTETLALLESATSELADCPVLMVGAYRPADAGDRWSSCWPRWRGAPRCAWPWAACRHPTWERWSRPFATARWTAGW
jgi:DNA-binding SARP family transcriptional activator